MSDKNTPYAEVIGVPIAHSKSPIIHRFWLEKLGIKADYRACHVKPDELEEYIENRRTDSNWRGCNVTIPHKLIALKFADLIEESARVVGASNCLSRDGDTLIASNTDVEGILNALSELHIIFGSETIPEACVIGTGGAARAALAALKQMGIEYVSINCRDQDKGKKLHKEFRFSGQVGAIDNADGLLVPHLIINATSLGMCGFDKFPRAVIETISGCDDKDRWVFDMVYSPLKTELLNISKRSGLKTIDGLAMLIGQAGKAFEMFFGEQAPQQHDAELRKLLVK